MIRRIFKLMLFVLVLSFSVRAMAESATDLGVKPEFQKKTKLVEMKATVASIDVEKRPPT
jgi:hypothetical protein